MKNQNTPTIEIQAVGNMTLGQQQAHARRNGNDSFISTDGRLYIRKGGRWVLMPIPKLSAQEEFTIRQICKGQPESVIQQLIMTVAMTKK